jgi:hypothetical protein
MMFRRWAAAVVETTAALILAVILTKTDHHDSMDPLYDSLVLRYAFLIYSTTYISHCILAVAN